MFELGMIEMHAIFLLDTQAIVELKNAKMLGGLVKKCRNVSHISVRKYPDGCKSLICNLGRCK